MALAVFLNIVGKQCIFSGSPWPSMQPHLRATRSPSHFLAYMDFPPSLKYRIYMEEKNREREAGSKSIAEKGLVLKMSIKIYRFVAPFKPLANQLMSYNPSWLPKLSKF
ncbi:hypothetical protein OIU79_016229 [Salix purpurea]|uniref:Uncharacterized protein n=1 Tax=Salix purpurea TaxID=77065 RepID=A0A9Q0PDR0_SALPP|nr:hypothetical protein OIU79_016229 [Salix purpurea]